MLDGGGWESGKCGTPLERIWDMMALVRGGGGMLDGGGWESGKCGTSVWSASGT